MKLSKAAEQYIVDAGRLRTRKSQQSMRAIVHQLCEYTGDKAASSYTADELTAFCLGDGGRGTAPNTVLSRRSALISLFDWLTYQQVCRTNPASTLRHTVRVRPKGVREHTWLTEAEVVDITRSFNLDKLHEHRDYIVFRSIVLLGLRLAEAASLDWTSFRRGLAEVAFVGKGAKQALLPTPQVLRADLERWRSVQPDGAVLFPRFRRHRDFDAGVMALRPEWSTPLRERGMYKIVKAIAEAHGHTALAPHDLRRSFAGILDTKDVKLRDVQRLMRHESVATTDRYLDSNPGRLAAVVDGVQWGA